MAENIQKIEKTNLHIEFDIETQIACIKINNLENSNFDIDCECESDWRSDIPEGHQSDYISDSEI